MLGDGEENVSDRSQVPNSTRLSLAIADLPLTPFGMKSRHRGSKVNEYGHPIGCGFTAPKLTRHCVDFPEHLGGQNCNGSNSANSLMTFNYVNKRRRRLKEKSGNPVEGNNDLSFIQNLPQYTVDSSELIRDVNICASVPQKKLLIPKNMSESFFSDIDDGSFIEFLDNLKIPDDDNRNVKNSSNSGNVKTHHNKVFELNTYYTCSSTDETKFSTSSKLPKAEVNFQKFLDKASNLQNLNVIAEESTLSQNSEIVFGDSYQKNLPIDESIIIGSIDFIPRKEKNGIMNSTIIPKMVHLIQSLPDLSSLTLEDSSTKKSYNKLNNKKGIDPLPNSLVSEDVSVLSSISNKGTEQNLRPNIVDAPKCENRNQKGSGMVEEESCERNAKNDFVTKWIRSSPFKESSFGTSFYNCITTENIKKTQSEMLTNEVLSQNFKLQISDDLASDSDTCYNEGCATIYTLGRVADTQGNNINKLSPQLDSSLCHEKSLTDERYIVYSSDRSSGDSSICYLSDENVTKSSFKVKLRKSFSVPNLMNVGDDENKATSNFLLPQNSLLGLKGRLSFSSDSDSEKNANEPHSLPFITYLNKESIKDEPKMIGSSPIADEMSRKNVNAENGNSNNSSKHQFLLSSDSENENNSQFPRWRLKLDELLGKKSVNRRNALKPMTGGNGAQPEVVQVERDGGLMAANSVSPIISILAPCNDDTSSDGSFSLYINKWKKGNEERVVKQDKLIDEVSDSFMDDSSRNGDDISLYLTSLNQRTTPFLSEGRQNPVVNTSSSSDSDECPRVFKSKTKKTPKFRIVKTPITDGKSQTLGTPKCLSFLTSLSLETPLQKAHPDAVPALKNFKREKEALIELLYNYFNIHVFEKKLPETMKITWNVRLTKTAGLCYYQMNKTMPLGRSSRIELSVKVIDNAGRLRDTLVHELCHAAAWIISGNKGCHGVIWKSWAAKAMKTFPELPKITRCHSYEIKYKYNYECITCGQRIGRHSKSMNTDTARCGYCYGRFELTVGPNPPSNQKSVSAPHRPNICAVTKAS